MWHVDDDGTLFDSNVEKVISIIFFKQMMNDEASDSDAIHAKL